MQKASRLALLTLFFLCPAVVNAEVKSLTFYRRQPFAGGMAFGTTGPYEVLTGVARFAVDPKSPPNQAIIDLELAPRNAEGKVEFEADICLRIGKSDALHHKTNTLARLYADAFDANAKLAEDFCFGHRFSAACAAAQAGCGHGREAVKLDAPKREKSRMKARQWLRADLAAWKKLLDDNTAKAPRAPWWRRPRRWFSWASGPLSFWWFSPFPW